MRSRHSLLPTGTFCCYYFYLPVLLLPNYYYQLLLLFREPRQFPRLQELLQILDEKHAEGRERLTSASLGGGYIQIVAVDNSRQRWVVSRYV